MTGCRYNAKNTLMKNYLYLAEQHGAKVMPLTTVTRVWPRAGGGYDVTVQVHQGEAAIGAARPGPSRAEQVVFAAAAIGTQKLLHRMKVEGHLPKLSDRLGFLSRTNSESILGAIAPDTRSTTATGSRSPRRSTPTRTPTSSRCATARAATRWRCCRRCSPTATAPGRAGGPG